MKAKKQKSEKCARIHIKFPTFDTKMRSISVEERGDVLWLFSPSNDSESEPLRWFTLSISFVSSIKIPLLLVFLPSSILQINHSKDKM